MAGPPSNTQLAEFQPPVRGVIRTKPSHQLAKDEAYDAANVIVRDSVLRPRPGLRRVSNSLPTATVPDGVESWNAATGYHLGDLVTWQGGLWRANFDSQEDYPDNNLINAWTLIGAVTGIPTGAASFRTAQQQPWLVVGTETGIYASRGARLTSKLKSLGATDLAPAFSGQLNGSLDHPSRFAALEFGTPPKVQLVHTNGVDPLLQWDGEEDTFRLCEGDGAFRQIANLSLELTAAAGNAVIYLTSLVANEFPEVGDVLQLDAERFKVLAINLAASRVFCERAFEDTELQAHALGAVIDKRFERPPPLFSDITTIGDHIIGIIPPYEVGWGAIRSTSAWPKLNRRFVAETTDPVVAIRDQGPMGGVLYKDETQWRIRFVGGTSEATAFVIDFDGEYEGPAGPAAIVNHEGTHIYMTRNGRVAVKDGSGHRWYCDGVWPVLRKLIDPPFANRIFGVYDPSQHEVVFFFPRRGDYQGVFVDDGGLPRGLLYVTLPKEVGPYAQGAWPGHLSTLWGGAVTCATRYSFGDKIKRVGIWPSDGATTFFNLGGAESADECSPDGIPVGEAQDNGHAFDFFWQTGLTKAGDGVMRIESASHYFEREANYGSIMVRPIRSYQLGRPAGERGEAQTIDLEKFPVKPFQGLDIRGVWHGLRYSFEPIATTPVSFVRWHGAVTFGHQAEP